MKDLWDRARIEFSKPLDEGQLEEVFKKLSQERKVVIRWGVEKTNSMSPERTQPDSTLRDSWGAISAIEKDQNFVSLPFTLKVSYFDEGITKYTALQFEMIPGYNERDYINNDPIHWDSFREYFENNSNFGEIFPPSFG